MGASSWTYFIPYQDDIDEALQILRQQVFEKGEYFKLDYGNNWRNQTEEAFLEGLKTETDPEVRDILLDDWRYLKDLPEPTDISSLLNWNRESGTHSIIDITDGVSYQPDFGTVSPLTDEQLMSIFGALKPTREMVESWIRNSDLVDLRDRWEGLYIIVFANDTPAEICFAGFSGD